MDGPTEADYNSNGMHIILIPEGFCKGRVVNLSHRHLVLVVLAGLVVLPAVLGWVSYRIYGQLTPDERGVDAAVVAVHRQELNNQRAALAAARADTETHIEFLVQRLGRLQAQMWRLNALGAHLASMAGLDQSEFDFSTEPAMGGPAPALEPTPAVLPALDAFEARLLAQRERLKALETLLMNRKLEAAVTPSGWPVSGGWISSGFGYRVDPFTGRRARHEGVDIASRRGSPIRALGDGLVRHAGPKTGYGNLVEITHGIIATRYAHTQEVLVTVGDRVSRGQVIATVGSSGRATGPHLHFEVVKGTRSVNPQPYLDHDKKVSTSKGTT